MKKIKTEVAIIGGGTGGMGSFRNARKHTDSVLLIEDHHFGTTCARVGCMPSKLLIAAGEARHGALNMDPFGVSLEGGVKVDGKKVMKRVQSERDRFVGFVLEDVEDFGKEHQLLGRAKFTSDNTLVVDDEIEVEFERAVIATGSRPILTPEWEALGDRLLTNESVFELEDIPESIAVLGPGVIGLELGSAFHNLGAKVTVYGIDDRIGGISDPVVLEKAKEIFNEELDMRLFVETSMKRVGDKVEVTSTDKDGNKKTETFDYLLAAVGRRPNVDNIGLENTSLKLDGRGVPVTDRYTMQTSLPHIFMAGDASNQVQLLHEASDQGVIAGTNAGIYPKVEKGLRRSAIGVVFSHPQIMGVGMRWRDVEAEYKDKMDDVVTGEVSFHNQGRSRVMLVNKGLLRVYADKKSGRFLGAEMIGPVAEHIAHLLAWAHQAELTIPAMLDMPFYHPVIEEGVRTALRDVNKKLA